MEKRHGKRFEKSEIHRINLAELEKGIYMYRIYNSNYLYSSCKMVLQWFFNDA